LPIQPSPCVDTIRGYIIDGASTELRALAVGPCSRRGALMDTMRHGHSVGDEQVLRVDVDTMDVDAQAGRHNTVMPHVGSVWSLRHGGLEWPIAWPFTVPTPMFLLRRAIGPNEWARSPLRAPPSSALAGAPTA
jgi:hypothetical protein